MYPAAAPTPCRPNETGTASCSTPSSGWTRAEMTLPELVAALERRAAEAERVGATAPVANVYRDVLAELRGADGAGPGAVAPPPGLVPEAGLDRWLTPVAVATRLEVAVRWVYRHKRELGGVKVGKYLRFPESALRRRLERRS